MGDEPVMRWTTVAVALGLLIAVPACAQPLYYGPAPAYSAYGPAPYPYGGAPRYWGGDRHHHHHAPPRHDHHGGHMGAVNGIMVGITAAGTMGATIAEGANHPVLVPSRERQAVVARDLLDAAIMVECHRQCGSLPTFWCCPSCVLQSPQHQPTTSAGVH
jgi:hypothetical protein